MLISRVLFLLSTQDIWGDPEAEPKSDPSEAKKSQKRQLPLVDHASMNYPPFRQNFYIEALEVKAMTDTEVKAYRETQLEGVQIRGKQCPRPILKWAHAGLPERIHQLIEKRKYAKPFPIQAQAIPAIMVGRDVIACAKTVSSFSSLLHFPSLLFLLLRKKLQTNLLSC